MALAGSTEQAPDERRERRTGRTVVADTLYGDISTARWADILLRTPEFRRLNGVSLSDVPGELLFGRRFPTRLEHARGVYHLARLARPRDRVLQLAALAHDLGHGPLSHLTEPLMLELLGIDHEQRSVAQLLRIRQSLAQAEARALSWVDWDEASRLVLGEGDDGRGELLNGRLDFDNADNVARFLSGAGLGVPEYDPVALARALRIAPEPIASRHLAPTRVYLRQDAAADALAWLRDRARTYDYLHEGHRNLAAHAMLEKAFSLLALGGMLTPSFFELTDAEALSFARLSGNRGAAALVESALDDRLYRCVYEAVLPDDAGWISALQQSWRDRLTLEAQLAAEAGLSPHDLVTEALVSSASRALPPIGNSATEREAEVLALNTTPAPCVLHVFVSPAVPRDYVRRLRMAVARLYEPQGANPRGSEQVG